MSVDRVIGTIDLICVIICVFPLSIRTQAYVWLLENNSDAMNCSSSPIILRLSSDVLDHWLRMNTVYMMRGEQMNSKDLFHRSRREREMLASMLAGGSSCCARGILLGAATPMAGLISSTTC